MPDNTDVKIVPENIRSVAAIYFAAQLEQMRLFDAADRVVEQFVQGLLPIGAGSAGRALDRYYWSRRDRMTAAERRILYSRVLGAPGGDSEKDVQPNRQFSELLLRFVSVVAEFGRMQEGVELSAAMETVRKAGRDLAANASLYGSGYTYFAARRLQQDIVSALAILKLPEVQKAYGASSPYQVIDRVSSLELGGASNSTRYRTMAEAGRKILDILARNSAKWSGASRRPLFRDRAVTAKKADISDSDRDTLLQSVEQWLAVSGVPDDQAGDFSQPAASVP